MMRILLLITTWMACMGLQASAQVTTVSDSGYIPPFQGTIGFKIRYEGPVPPASLPYLPDSMSLMVGPDGCYAEYHGGLSKQLQSALLWDGSTQRLWLIDHDHKTADSISFLWKPLTPAMKELKEPDTLLGHPCKAFSYITPVAKPKEKPIHNEKVWVNDSIWYPGTLPDTLNPFTPTFLSGKDRRIPLRTRRISIDGVISITEATSIQQHPVDPAQLQLPVDYQHREFDPSRPWHPILNRRKDL